MSGETGADETIVALSTPRGPGARGIIRLSGPHSLTIAAGVFRPNHSPLSASTPGFAAMDGWIQFRDLPPWPASIWVFRSPRSATGEDLVEFHVPGAPIALDRLVSGLQGLGARAATPGEFTRRAFLNGKIDLSQAEAVAALIHAQNDGERRAALHLLGGRMAEKVRLISAELVRLAAFLELSIDFSDQDIDIVDMPTFSADLQRVLAELSTLKTHSIPERRLLDRPRLLLCGPANAGKSSLFNRLCGEERALVAPIAGTTRDILSVECRLEDVSVILIDSAGEDVVRDEIDLISHERRRSEAARADFNLMVMDGRNLTTLKPDNGENIYVATHADLVAPEDRMSGWIWVSSKTDEGLPDLQSALLRRLRHAALDQEFMGLHCAHRHADILSRAADHLNMAHSDFDAGCGVEVVAAGLRTALGILAEFSGELYSEAVLDAIMRDFCIGK